MLRENNIEKGLTLLEVMISIFILSLILTIVYGAYTSNVEAIQRARIYGEVDQVARVVLDRMSKDLQSAYIKVPISYDNTKMKLGMVSSDAQMDDQPFDRIDFTCLGHFAVGPRAVDTDLCEVGYYLEQDPDNQDSFVLYRRDDPTPDDDITEGGVSLPMAKTIKGLNITFQNVDGETSETWDSFGGDTIDQLPSLITIEIKILDQEGNIHTFSTSVHPLIAGT